MNFLLEECGEDKKCKLISTMLPLGFEMLSSMMSAKFMCPFVGFRSADELATDDQAQMCNTCEKVMKPINTLVKNDIMRGIINFECDKGDEFCENLESGVLGMLDMVGRLTSEGMMCNMIGMCEGDPKVENSCEFCQRTVVGPPWKMVLAGLSALKSIAEEICDDEDKDCVSFLGAVIGGMVKGISDITTPKEVCTEILGMCEKEEEREEEWEREKTSTALAVVEPPQDFMCKVCTMVSDIGGQVMQSDGTLEGIGGIFKDICNDLFNPEEDKTFNAMCNDIMEDVGKQAFKTGGKLVQNVLCDDVLELCHSKKDALKSRYPMCMDCVEQVPRAGKMISERGRFAGDSSQIAEMACNEVRRKMPFARDQDCERFGYKIKESQEKGMDVKEICMEEKMCPPEGAPDDIWHQSLCHMCDPVMKSIKRVLTNNNMQEMVSGVMTDMCGLLFDDDKAMRDVCNAMLEPMVANVMETLGQLMAPNIACPMVLECPMKELAKKDRRERRSAVSDRKSTR